MTQLRVAVIGYGKLGSIHARLINESKDFELVGIVDPLEDNRIKAIDELGVRTTSSAGEMLDEIECAIVATPTRFHYEVCNSLLDANKHVFVEKPITARLQEATALVEKASAAGLTLQVGHVVRFDPHFRAAEAIIEEPRLIECTRASGYTFRSMDVGVTLDLMIHDLDLVLALIKSPVASIQAIGAPVIGPHEDVAHARLTFENGAMANLSASRSSYEQVRKMQVVGAHGFVSIDFTNNETITSVGTSQALQDLDLDPTQATQATRDDISERFFTEILPKHEVAITPCNAIAEEHKDFFRAISTQGTPKVSGETGAKVLEIATRIVKTIEAGTTNESVAMQGPHFQQHHSIESDASVYRSHVRGV